jgi:hypothetical protein
VLADDGDKGLPLDWRQGREISEGDHAALHAPLASVHSAPREAAHPPKKSVERTGLFT